MPTVCEIKVALKAKGIKGISGLNKTALQSLLNKGGSNVETALSAKSDKSLYNKAEKFLNKMDKEMNKPKPFTPAATKGDTPKIAEKKITKKARVPQQLRLTYKEPDEAKKEAKKDDEDLDLFGDDNEEDAAAAKALAEKMKAD
jgi:hypothetical protein